jgi:hypothetical protein
LAIIIHFPIAGFTLPAGANIGVGPFFMGRDEKIWKNAGDFIPERFDSPDVKIHPYAHVAFSAGPRNVCKSIIDMAFELAFSYLELPYFLFPLHN